MTHSNNESGRKKRFHYSCAKICKKDGFKDMRVVVKSKNVKALSFYKSVGCKIVNDKFTKDSVELMLSF